MKNKIVGIFVFILLLATYIPIVQSLDDGTITTTPSSSSELRRAFIFGRYTNLTTDVENLTITIETVNIWVIYKEPFSFDHFPRGTHITFSMYTSYGRMFLKRNLLFLSVELDI